MSTKNDAKRWRKNIPAELQELDQWVVWKEEKYADENGKPRKVPYNPNSKFGSKKAYPNKANTWGSFDLAVQIATEWNFYGIGFVFSDDDPYCGIDQDDKPHKRATKAEKRQHKKDLKDFDSYTERSPGGDGRHIIIMGSFDGRSTDVQSTGVYCRDRYFTFTGDVIRDRPIRKRQKQLNKFLKRRQTETGSSPITAVGMMNTREGHEDNITIIERAREAKNGATFSALFDSGDTTGYPSRSEADMALLEIIAFYTPSDEQVFDIFRESALFRPEKEERHRRYCIPKARVFVERDGNVHSNGYGVATADDFESVSVSLEDARSTSRKARKPDNVVKFGVSLPSKDFAITKPPSKLVHRIAEHVLSVSPHPIPEAGTIAALALMAQVSARAYNVNGTGLNLYLILMAKTGFGKGGMQRGISSILKPLGDQRQAVRGTKGPSRFASGQAVHSRMLKSPCVLARIPEFGLMVQQLVSTRRNDGKEELERLLLELFGLSGYGEYFEGADYKRDEDSQGALESPCLSILGETTPLKMLDKLGPEHITSGLLSRCTVIRYTGDYPEENPGEITQPPSEALLKSLVKLVDRCAHSYSYKALVAAPSDFSSADDPLTDDPTRRQVCDVKFSKDAARLLDEFKLEVRKVLNGNDEMLAEVYSRSIVKIMRVAALLAVGEDRKRPVVSMEQMQWAIDFEKRAARTLLEPFIQAETGGGDAHREYVLMKAAKRYSAIKSRTRQSTYKVPKLFAKEDSLIPRVYFWRKVRTVSAFNDHRLGGQKALDFTLTNLQRNGQLVRVKSEDLKTLGYEGGQGVYAIAGSEE